MHSCAFGLGIKKENLNAILNLTLPPIDNSIMVDAEVEFDELNLQDCEELLRFNRFYMSGFERPIFRINNIPTDIIYELGKTFTNKGFNIKPNDKVSFIKFNGLSQQELEDVKNSKSINVVGELNINSYDNSIQFIIVDYEVKETSTESKYEYEF